MNHPKNYLALLLFLLFGAGTAFSQSQHFCGTSNKKVPHADSTVVAEDRFGNQFVTSDYPPYNLTM